MIDRLKSNARDWILVLLAGLVHVFLRQWPRKRFTYDDEGLIVQNAFIEEVSDCE